MSSTEAGTAHTDAGTGRRSGGRAGRQALRASHVVEAETYLTRTMKPFEIVSDEGLEIIEHNAETILQEVGIEIRDYPSALKVYADAGASVDGTRVRFHAACAGRSCRPARRANTSSTRATREERAHRWRRDGVRAQLRLAVRLRSRQRPPLRDDRRLPKLRQAHVQSLYLHHSGGTVCEPVDVPVSKRHLDMVLTHLRYSDKPFMGSVTAASRAQDSVDMARIGFGGDLGDRTVITSLINASSPLVWDGTMLGAAEVYARNNQACIITPFILAGAMAPDLCRSRRADAGRVAGRHDVHPVDPPRRAGDLRIVRLVDVDADRRADLRHTRAGDRALHDRRAGSTPRRAVPLRWLAVGVEASRRAGCLRERGTLLPTVLAGPTSCCMPPAGKRVAYRSATRSSSWTKTSAG